MKFGPEINEFNWSGGPAEMGRHLADAPLYRIEHAFAQLGRWRRLSRCYEGTEAFIAWYRIPDACRIVPCVPIWFRNDSVGHMGHMGQFA